MLATQLFLINRAKHASIKSKISKLTKLHQYNLSLLKGEALFLERVLRGIKKWLGSSTTLRYPMTAHLLAIWVGCFGDLPMAVQATGVSVFCSILLSESVGICG